MRFLWKSQLKRERGKFLPKNDSERGKKNRKERLKAQGPDSSQHSLGVITLWLFFLGTTVYLFFFSSYLVLSPPYITGLHSIDKTAVQATVAAELSERYAGIVSRNRFFLFGSEALSRTLRARYPLIRNIHIQQIFPERINIDIEERDTLILWCSAEQCVHVLEDGTTLPVTDVYNSEENRAKTLTLRDTSGQPLQIGEGVLSQDFVSTTLVLRQSLKERFHLEIERKITLSSRFANELRVRVEDFEIYFSTKFPVNVSLDALALLFEKEIPVENRSNIQYIDLRTENRIFYRYKDGKEEEMKAEQTPTLPVVKEEKSAKKKK